MSSVCNKKRSKMVKDMLYEIWVFIYVLHSRVVVAREAMQ